MKKKKYERKKEQAYKETDSSKEDTTLYVDKIHLYPFITIIFTIIISFSMNKNLKKTKN